jgi:N-acetylglucosaminyldiphosphoundecaprenol N-acetyl-beta-D-mannosaminyltransferase
MVSRSESPEGVALRGLWLDALTEAECVDFVLDSIQHQRGGWIITVNLDHLRRVVHDPEYKQFTDQASLKVCDGVPLLWAARLQGTALPGRVAGSNLVHSATEAAAGRYSLYLLGGDPTTAERAAQILKTRYPGLEIAGTECPPMGFEHDESHLAAMRQRLREASPDIVFVALGSPKQERLIQEIRSVLPQAWWIGVGISFSFITGDVVRAPRWLQRCGLEWMHRLSQEPRRLFRRYLIEGLPFAISLMAGALACRARPGCPDSRRRRA